MNLLIAENEARLRNSLANNIPWEEHGIEVIGLSSNGVEALQMINSKKPELLLLDIHMPEMDGLTLAGIVLKQDPSIKIVILSGHDNFAYAQTALELGVSKYLLKPAGNADILQAVLDAAGQLRQELEKRHNQAMLQEKWANHLPRLQEAFLQVWITGKYVAWEIERKSNDLQIDLREGQQYAVAVVDLDPLPEGETRFRSQDSSLLQFSILSIAKDCIDADAGWVFPDFAGLTVIVFRTDMSEEANPFQLRVQSLVTKLISVITECLKITVSAGISGSSTSAVQVSGLYQKARKALQERVVYGDGIAIPYSECHDPTGPVSIPSNIEKSLEAALEATDSEKAARALDDLWELGMERADNADGLFEHLLYLSSLLVRIFQKQGVSIKEIAGDDYVYFQNLQALATKEQIYQWLHRSVRHFIRHQNKQRKSSNYYTVRKIFQMVEDEMNDDLTLHMVADRLYINPSYLSRVFKKETGQSFSSYVLERKMERAKAALMEGAKVYDAATMVGYRDVSYFTRVFRKYWGITPGGLKP